MVRMLKTHKQVNTPIKRKVTVHTDGGALNNPGPAAIGVVIQGTADATPRTYSASIGDRTNNEAEYEAVIFALKKLKSLYGKEVVRDVSIEFFSDSTLMVQQLNHKFKIEHDNIVPLFIKIWNLLIHFGSVTFRYIPREQNRLADGLVKGGLSQ